METVQPCFYQWVHSDTSVRTIFCHSIGWCKACARTPTISIHECRFRHFTSSHCYGTTVFDFMHKNSPYNLRRNPDFTRSETYFRQDLFPAYLFFRRQFHAIVIFRLKSISDLDSGSLSNFFYEFIYEKLKIFTHAISAWSLDTIFFQNSRLSFSSIHTLTKLLPPNDTSGGYRLQQSFINRSLAIGRVEQF